MMDFYLLNGRYVKMHDDILKRDILFGTTKGYSLEF